MRIAYEKNGYQAEARECERKAEELGFKAP